MSSVPKFVERRIPRRLLGRVVCVTVVLSVAISRAPGQAAVEYGHATAGAAAAGSSISRAASKMAGALSSTASRTQPATKSASPHLPARTGEAPEVTNRKALERRAGTDGAKLSLKSVPPNATVRIDGNPVGTTPLVLVLAPGRYSVELEGPRREFAREQVELRAQETRELALPLRSRYLTHIDLH